MKLEEEVDHYLAGLRESSQVSNNATIASKPNQIEGHTTVSDSSEKDPHEGCLHIRRHKIPSGRVRTVASCYDSKFSGEKAIVLSQAFPSLEAATAPLPASSMSVATSSINGFVHDPNKSTWYTSTEAQNPAPIAWTRGIDSPEIFAPDRNGEQGTNGETPWEIDNTVDVAADAELEIIQDYASSESPEASVHNESMYSSERDGVVANEDMCQVLQPSCEVEGKDWDDCSITAS